jgi:hypothetical protein
MEKPTNNKNTNDEHSIREWFECSQDESFLIPLFDSSGDRSEATTVQPLSRAARNGVSNTTTEYSQNNGRDSVQEPEKSSIRNAAVHSGVSCTFRFLQN